MMQETDKGRSWKPVDILGYFRRSWNASTDGERVFILGCLVASVAIPLVTIAAILITEKG